VHSLKVAIQLASLKQPFRKALITASKLGATGVEIDARTQLRPRELGQTGLRQLRKLLDDLNLQVAAVRFRTRRGYDEPSDLDTRVQATREAMKLASSLGCSVVTNRVGRIYEDESDSQWQQMLGVLNDLGEYGHHVGTWLAAETGLEDGTQLAQLLRSLPDGMLGIDFNPGLLIINGHCAIESLRQLGPQVVHVRANDGVQDISHGHGSEVQLGRGSADFIELIAVLEEFSYRGWFTTERQDSSDPIRELGMAIKYLKNVMQ